MGVFQKRLFYFVVIITPVNAGESFRLGHREVPNGSPIPGANRQNEKPLTILSGAFLLK
jgi:hypothetical protein